MPRLLLPLFIVVLLASCDNKRGDTAGTNSSTPTAQPHATEETPDTLVYRLYRDHSTPRSPFFTTDSAAIARYCTPELTALLLRDARYSQSHGEVGALDGDPFYNAQDTSITDFKILPATYPEPDRRAEVVVTFRNYDAPQRIVFQLVKTTAGWRVADINWGDGYTLRGILSNDAAHSEE